MKPARSLFAAASMSLAVFFMPAPSLADGRPPEAILAELEAVKQPEFDQARSRDAAYREEYTKARMEAQSKRASLIAELYKAAPDNPQIATLLPERWGLLLATRAKDAPATIETETVEVLAKSKEGPLALDAAYFRAQAAQRAEAPAADAMARAEEFIKLAPQDERGASLLYFHGRQYLKDDAAGKIALYKRIAKDWPESRSGKTVAGEIRQTEGVGKPFELQFTDAVSGKSISMADLKGKVVVVDFWATWCGPCVAEMPKMKELYAEWKDKGVEFIGVSLDQPKEKGGLDKLLAFCKDKEIAWPQFYQGNYWDSEFSKSWGINGIPCLFIVDKEGVLHSTQARGKLDKLIPELLAKPGKQG